MVLAKVLIKILFRYLIKKVDLGIGKGIDRNIV